MYGKTQFTYDLFGRVHLDYLDLYRKHTYHEMHSYRLDFVGEYEVGDHKIAYEGSLDKLYNEDFEKFIAYNRQDVMLLVKIDNKLKFIELSNDLAHTNGVLLNTTLGSVLLIDNAITNEAHDLGYHIPARPPREFRDEELVEDDDELGDGTPKGIVGAYVADPVQGMHDWIGGVDINSLYPSAIRTLNMSKETVVGQIRMDATNRLIQKRMKEEKRSFADSWNEMFSILEYAQMMNREQVILTVDLNDGSSVNMSGDELYRWIFENPKRKMCVSANGTIFSVDREGIVPGLLARWYSQRKQMQAQAREYVDLLSGGIELKDGLEKYAEPLESALNDPNIEGTWDGQHGLVELMKKGNYAAVVAFMRKYNVTLEDHKIILRSQDPDVINEFKIQRDFWDRRQLIRKILLNSLYGAIGNASSAWHDSRIAQSTTLTGRCIVRHMGSKINELIAGDYNHKGASVIYGDSVTGDTIIRTDKGNVTIEQLFNECLEHSTTRDGKEYGLWSLARVIGFNGHEMEPVLSGVEAVMRHKTRKKLYRITTDNGKQITVTEDHSLMVDRDGLLVEVKPNEIRDTDNIITLLL
jgi:DNA polymerase elongation subunit (family B)